MHLNIGVLPFNFQANSGIKSLQAYFSSIMAKYFCGKLLQGQRLKKLQARQLREEKEEVRLSNHECLRTLKQNLFFNVKA